MARRSITSWNLGGGQAARGSGLEQAMRLAGGVEVTKAVRSRSTNVALQSHQFVAGGFALSKDMIASSQMLGAIGLLGQVQQP